MRYKRAALVLADPATIASTAGVSYARTSDLATADARRHRNQARQNLQQQQREMDQMNQSMKWAQAGMNQLHRSVVNQLSDSAIDFSGMQNLE